MRSQLKESNHLSQIIVRGTLGNLGVKSTPIDSLFTLRKLQKTLVIPRNLQPTQTKRKEIYMPHPTVNKKYLLISTRNTIYYGCLSGDGFPEDPKALSIFAEGSYYEGKFENGKPNGQGRLSNLECSYVYEGQWKNGLPHGNGRQKIDNNYYEGQFQEGKKHGEGKQTYADGSRYEGHFENNVIQGEGKYINESNIWDGSWKDGYMDGSGHQIIAKKTIKNLEGASEYKGDFKKGEKDGKGVFKWHGKYQYDGQFQKGQLHGEGLFKFKGRVYSGEWYNGTQVRITEVMRSHSSASRASRGSHMPRASMGQKK